MKNLFSAALLSVVLASPAIADVKIEEPWVRATVPQQKATGAFMRITAQNDARLVAVRSPVAGKTEIHEMILEKDVMKMRPMVSIALPAGKTVELRPGAHHVMLLDLANPVRDGEVIPLTLIVEDKDGKRETIDVKAVARPLHSMGGGDHGR